jgi:hypothetical protein
MVAVVGLLAVSAQALGAMLVLLLSGASPPRCRRAVPGQWSRCQWCQLLVLCSIGSSAPSRARSGKGPAAEWGRAHSSATGKADSGAACPCSSSCSFAGSSSSAVHAIRLQACQWWGCVPVGALPSVPLSVAVPRPLRAFAASYGEGRALWRCAT